MKKNLKAFDLFCGAGGTSTGMLQACGESGRNVDLTVINHWQTAIATHSHNHPNVKHLLTSIDNVNFRDLCERWKLDLLWASPECTHHSVARGGRPINEQSRATAWCVVRCIDAVMPRKVLVENVPEFTTWGPTKRVRIPNPKYVEGESQADLFTGRPEPKTLLVERPDPARKGETFQAWVAAIEAFGYRVEWRVLCAADYGDATTRRRLFVQAVRNNGKCIWPKPTHYPPDKFEEMSKAGTVNGYKKWVPAREIIDWGIEGQSIYDRKKPLKPKTMRRIAVGLQKYGLAPFIVPQQRGGKQVKPVTDPVSPVTTRPGEGIARPYLVKLKGTGTANDVDEPIGTIAAGGQHHGIAEPFLINTAHEGDRKPGSVDAPLKTIAGNRGDESLVQSFLVQMQGKSNAQPADAPVPALTTQNKMGVAEPLLTPFTVPVGGPKRNEKSVDEPLHTILCKESHGIAEPVLHPYQRFAVAEPFLVEYRNGEGSEKRVKPVDKPIPTQDTQNRFGLCEPFILSIDQQSAAPESSVHSTDKPLSTVVTKQRHCIAKPFLVKFYGTGTAVPVTEPLDSITCKDRFGLVVPGAKPTDDPQVFLLDIRFRMLQPHELSAAQGFPVDYEFKGTKTDIVKQIGNSVPVQTARALVAAALSDI